MLKRVGHAPALQMEHMKAVQNRIITIIKMRDEVLNPKLQIRKVKTIFHLEIHSSIKAAFMGHTEECV